MEQVQNNDMIQNGNIIQTNKEYWNDHADLWFGTTALPKYGVKFVTEDEVHLFGDVTGKKMLEICCGIHLCKCFGKSGICD